MASWRCSAPPPAPWPTCALPPDPLASGIRSCGEARQPRGHPPHRRCRPVDAVLVGDPRTDLFNPNVIRASIGCVFSVPVVAAPMADILVFLRAGGIRSYAAALTPAARSYLACDFTQPTALVLGTEADGLTTATQQACDETIIIPMMGRIDSLNVSVAGAVLAFEAVRQRATSGTSEVIG